jgi:23S rRNA-/tRNA-specific pseudouridylate synthase
VTHYEPIEVGEDYTVVCVRLETGRTHQIRVHFASLGTPLYGDTMYGEVDERLSHQALHCAKVRFVHPITGEEIECEADMPEDMKTLLKSLRNN